MSFNFAKTKERTVSKTDDYSYLDIDGKEKTESITVEFYESCLTPSFIQSMMNLSNAKKFDVTEVARQLSKAIKSWSLIWQDLDQDEPQPFPPTFENISEVCDQKFLEWLITQASSIFEGNAQTPSKSRSTSARSAN